jgi:hypothetical protein
MNVRNPMTGTVHARSKLTQNGTLCGLRPGPESWDTSRGVTCERCIAVRKASQR